MNKIQVHTTNVDPLQNVTGESSLASDGEITNHTPDDENNVRPFGKDDQEEDNEMINRSEVWTENPHFTINNEQL
ncbi:hypothetical protein TRFO_20953 [Tritrichomonas foetus]|uniref:Uncharacterized protein n=1 Tax=Tritrichomonas foetus TaxID=1144522 RepID=A0A1J4KGA0_9EUKA|nr:hypothetical protein TRFO_20953 [Tritrichomonas foetus]|eukprot:OHT09968.1 hypothetical protein TRFO_20953 [Tritrichomonas foetus]